MKNIKLHMLLALTLGLLASGSAMADRGHWGGNGGGHWHGNIGLYIGPGFGPYYSRPYYPSYYGDPFYYGYPSPYYSYPPTVIVRPQQPPMYIEQGQEPQLESPQSSYAPQQDNFWYHCDRPEGYYPYIKDCPQGSQKVVPEPPRR